MKGKCISKQKQWEETFFFVQHPMNSWLSKPRMLLHLATLCVLNSTGLIPESLYNPELVTIFWYLSHLLCKVGRIVWLPTQLTKTRTSGRFDAFFFKRKKNNWKVFLITLGRGWYKCELSLLLRVRQSFPPPPYPRATMWAVWQAIFKSSSLEAYGPAQCQRENTDLLLCVCVFVLIWWSIF